jgi:SAM-dependent methyltransferase
MTLPSALDRHLTDELAVLNGQQGDGAQASSPDGAAPSPPVEPPSRRPTWSGVKGRIRNLAIRGVTQGLRRLGHARVGRDFVEPFVVERTTPLDQRLAQLDDKVSNLSAQIALLLADRGETAVDRINQSLLKNDVVSLSGRIGDVLGEIREQERRLLELGMAFAPGTGLAGAGIRFAELREQINSVERRLRFSANGAPATTQAADTASNSGAESRAGSGSTAASVTSELFNYVGFERRFRGDPEEILRMQTERYADLLAAHAPVVDVGCGRGELIEALEQRGVACIGVDTDSGMVAEGRARGLDIRHTDVLSFLEEAEPQTLGSVFSAHLAEHLELDVLIRFLELSVEKLRPGGVFVAETPNPASLIVLGNSYILDPTHVRPLHPSLLAFLCETAGFRDVRLEFYSPASSYHLGLVTSVDAPDWVKTLNANAERLNDVLFGPQEYAVVATAPS